MSIAAVIAAAGASSRMGGIKKEYRYLPQMDTPESAYGLVRAPLTVLGASVLAFAQHEAIKLIVVAHPAGGLAEARAALPADWLGAKNPATKTTLRPFPPILFVAGGDSRRRSVHNALLVLADKAIDYVLIHDGARPWVDTALIDQVIAAVKSVHAVIPVLPLTETPKEIDEAGMIITHPRRAAIAAAQTPQAFAFPDILRAHEEAAEREAREGRDYTDDAEVWAEFIGQVATVKGSGKNKKITFPEDLS